MDAGAVSTPGGGARAAVALELLQELVPAWALTLGLMLEPVVRPLNLALPLTLAVVVGAGPGSR